MVDVHFVDEQFVDRNMRFGIHPPGGGSTPPTPPNDIPPEGTIATCLSESWQLCKEAVGSEEPL